MKNTTLCYIEKDGKYLMIHRVKRKGDGNDNKWLGVGGHFEDRESPFDCVLREAREETGLTLLSPKYRGIVTFVSDEYETETTTAAATTALNHDVRITFRISS